MARLIVNDLDVETADKLERRVRRLGTTLEEEASRLHRTATNSEPDGQVRRRHVKCSFGGR